jgi:hypothetical protein
LRIELLNAQSSSQAAGQATWPPDPLTLHLIHLGHLAQVDAARTCLRKYFLNIGLQLAPSCHSPRGPLSHKVSRQEKSQFWPKWGAPKRIATL